MKKRSSKIVSCLYFSILVLSIIIGGAFAWAAPLVFWLDGNIEETPVIVAVTERWNEEHPDVPVEVVSMPAQDPYLQKLEVAAASGVGPDIVRLDELFIPQFAESNVISDVDALARGSNGLNFEDLTATALAMAEYKGKYWGYPENYSWCELAYRKDMFSTAGLDPEKAPETWTEFLEYSKKLTTGNTYGFIVQPYDWWWLAWFWGNGGEIFNEDQTECLLNSPEGVEALQFYVDLYQKYKVVPPAAVAAFRTGGGGPAFSAENAFANGMVAMLQIGSWLNQDYRRYAQNPENAVETYAWAPLPVKEEKNIHNVSTIGGRVLCVTTLCKNKEEAWDYIVYLAENQVEEYKKIIESKDIEEALKEIPLYTLATRKSSLSLPIGQHPHVKIFFERADIDPRLRPRFTGWIRCARELNTQLQAALVGQETPQEALDKVVEVFQEEMQKTKK